MKRLARTRLPDPYLPWSPHWEALAFASANPGSAALISSNNRALYVPFYLPVSATVYALSFVATNGTGNYDIGIYNDTFARLASSGSTAMTAAGVKTLATSLRLGAGKVFYAAFAFSSTAGTILRWAPGLRSVINAGLFQEDSAVPLPATATPVRITETNMPLFALGVR